MLVSDLRRKSAINSRRGRLPPAYYYNLNRSKIGGVKQRGSPAAKYQTITVDNGSPRSSTNEYTRVAASQYTRVTAGRSVTVQLQNSQ